MILCLDAGNSRVKWGLHDGGRWRAQGVVAHDGVAHIGDQLPAAPHRVAACNVAGAPVGDAVARLAGRLGIELQWLHASAAAAGVRNGYDRPGQLGADRWAAAIGARGLQAGAVVVVMAGTATTIDLLDADGLFRGGLILPGLDLMRSALARGTAGLPLAAGRYGAVPTNTDDAIVSGSLHATLGAITRMRAALGDAAPVLVSGGHAPTLAALIDPPCRTVEHLVLEGLVRWARADAAGR